MPRTTHILALLLVAIMTNSAVSWQHQRRVDAVAQTAARLEAKVDCNYVAVPAGQIIRDLGARLGVRVRFDRSSTAVEDGFARLRSIGGMQHRGRDAIRFACADGQSLSPDPMPWHIAEDGDGIIVGSASRRWSQVRFYDLPMLQAEFVLGSPDVAQYQRDVHSAIRFLLGYGRRADADATFGWAIIGQRLCIVDSPSGHTRVNATFASLSATARRAPASNRLIRPTLTEVSNW